MNLPGKVVFSRIHTIRIRRADAEGENATPGWIAAFLCIDQPPAGITPSTYLASSDLFRPK